MMEPGKPHGVLPSPARPGVERHQCARARRRRLSTRTIVQPECLALSPVGNIPTDLVARSAGNNQYGFTLKFTTKLPSPSPRQPARADPTRPGFKFTQVATRTTPVASESASGAG